MAINGMALLSCPFVSSVSREQASDEPKLLEILSVIAARKARRGSRSAHSPGVASLAHLVVSTAVALNLHLYFLYLVLSTSGRAGLLPQQLSAG